MGTLTTTPRLLTPIRVGDLKLAHRVVHAPLTRLRNDAAHVPTELGLQYYSQRASEPGSLLITEGTLVAAKAAGIPHTPGIWNEAQIAAWKKIVDAVHAKGSYIFLQLGATGRVANPAVLQSEDPSFHYVSASPIPLPQVENTPRALTKDEIREYAELFATSAYNGVHRAGFDGVEIHGGNGGLVHQFLASATNVREDEYGGSIENRATFALEVVDAIVKTVGQKKTALRISPFFSIYGMEEKDPYALYSHLVTRLRELFPDLAYIHSIEPRMEGLSDTFQEATPDVGRGNDFLRDIWAPRPFVVAGGYSKQTALLDAEKYERDLVAIGRQYLANPDLVRRIREDLPLNQYDRSTFYAPLEPKGYIDYPTVDQGLAN